MHFAGPHGRSGLPCPIRSRLLTRTGGCRTLHALAEWASGGRTRSSASPNGLLDCGTGGTCCFVGWGVGWQGMHAGSRQTKVFVGSASVGMCAGGGSPLEARGIPGECLGPEMFPAKGKERGMSPIKPAPFVGAVKVRMHGSIRTHTAKKSIYGLQRWDDWHMILSFCSALVCLCPCGDFLLKHVKRATPCSSVAGMVPCQGLVEHQLVTVVKRVQLEGVAPKEVGTFNKRSLIDCIGGAPPYNLLHHAMMCPRPFGGLMDSSCKEMECWYQELVS